MNRLFKLILFSLISIQMQSQSIFDKFESKLQGKLSISVGGQFSWYKNAHIYFEQSNYNRSLEIHNVKANGRVRFNQFIRGEIGTTQYRVDLKYKLSERYSFQIEAVHLDYLIDLGKDYYQRGLWDGNQINYVGNLNSKFTLLEHSNGINIWKLGLERKMFFNPNSKFLFSTGIQGGFVFSATQAYIYSPQGSEERFDPGNSFVGANISSHSELGFKLKSNWHLFLNFTYFQMRLNKASINEFSYVTQDLRGSNYGLSIRFYLP